MRAAHPLNDPRFYAARDSAGRITIVKDRECCWSVERALRWPWPPAPIRGAFGVDHTSVTVALTGRITKLVLQSCTLGCLSSVSITKRV